MPGTVLWRMHLPLTAMLLWPRTAVLLQATWTGSVVVSVCRSVIPYTMPYIMPYSSICPMRCHMLPVCPTLFPLLPVCPTLCPTLCFTLPVPLLRYARYWHTLPATPV
eukprot:1416274-Rhodomonas_salina.2